VPLPSAGRDFIEQLRSTSLPRRAALAV